MSWGEDLREANALAAVIARQHDLERAEVIRRASLWASKSQRLVEMSSKRLAFTTDKLRQWLRDGRLDLGNGEAFLERQSDRERKE